MSARPRERRARHPPNQHFENTPNADVVSSPNADLRVEKFEIGGDVEPRLS